MHCIALWPLLPEFLALKHESRILGHLSNPVRGFSMMEQVRLCAVWPMENWLCSSLNQIQGWSIVRESYSCALEKGPLGGRPFVSFAFAGDTRRCDDDGFGRDNGKKKKSKQRISSARVVEFQTLPMAEKQMI